MRNGSLAILTLLLGFAIGGASGFLLGSTGSGEVQAAAPVVVTAGDEGRGAASPVASASEDVLAQPAALEAGDENKGWDRDAQNRAIEAKAKGLSQSVAARVKAEVQAAVDPTWTGVITGEVVDESGEPIAGATVLTNGVQSWYDGRVTAKTTEDVGRAYAGRPALEEELLKTAKRLETSRLTLPQTVTDEAGRFTLSSLEPGTHSIAAYAEGYVFKSQRGTTGEAMRVMASKVGAFELDVRLPDGKAPGEAFVFALGSDDRESTLGKWTPASPEIRLSGTRRRIRVMSGEVRSYEYNKHTASFVSDPIVLDATSSDAGPQTIALREVTQLRIAVRDESAALPHVTPWVKYVSTGGEGAAIPTEIERRRGSGPFIATDLSPGTYEIQAGRGTETAEVTTEVEVVQGLNETELVLGDIDSSNFIVITCRDLSGQPVQDVKFRYQTKGKEGGGSRSGGLYNMSEHPGGEFWVGWSKVLDGKYTREGSEVFITASTGSFGSQVQQVGPDGRVDFTFAEPCDLIVEVGNAPAGKVQVRAMALKEDEKLGNHSLMYSGGRGESGVAIVDGDGRGVIGKLQPGRYRILAQVKKSDWELSAPVAEQEVTLSGGEMTIRLVCSALHELVVVAPDLEPGAQMGLQKVSLVDEHGLVHAGNERLDAEKRVVFSGLAPGTYMLMNWGTGSAQQMEITVPCGEVTFAPMEVNGYAIISVKPDTAGYRAGLQVGDILVGAGEHRVQGDAIFFNRLWIEMSEGPTTVTILRSGREINLEVEKIDSTDNAWAQFGVNWRATATGR